MFVAQVPPRVIDENSPHQLRGNGEEVPAVLPVHLPLAEQLQIGFVDDRRRLQAIVAPLARELPGRQRPEFLVDDRDEAFQRLLVSGPPLLKDARDLVGCGRLVHDRIGVYVRGHGSINASRAFLHYDLD